MIMIRKGEIQKDSNGRMWNRLIEKKMKARMIFGIAALVLLAAACNQKEEFIPEETMQGIPFTATVKAGDISSKALTDNTTSLQFAWAADETLALVYEVGGTPYNTTATVASVDGSGNATITATLQSGVTNNTPVTLIYPASAADGTTGNILASAITTQDGSLSLARDIRKGSGTIKVDGTATLAGGATLTAQYALCKFTVKDVDGTNNLSVSSFVVKDASDNVIATVTPSPAASTIYVTLPASSELLWFEAVASDKPYVAKGTASLSAGYFYTPTVKMATIFNIIGANGKFYKDKAAAVAASTTAAAIIAYVGDDTAENGYKHGLAISMKNANSGTSTRWKTTNDPASNYNGDGHQFTDYAAAIAAKESGLALSTISGRDNVDDYPAFYHALHNTISVEEGMTASKPSSGTTDWFLPSVFQWNQIMIGLTGITTGLTTTLTAGYGANNLLTNLAATGFDNCRLAPITGTNVLHTSTEYDETYKWNYQTDATTGKGGLSYSQKVYSAYVRAALAF